MSDAAGGGLQALAKPNDLEDASMSLRFAGPREAFAILLRRTLHAGRPRHRRLRRSPPAQGHDVCLMSRKNPDIAAILLRLCEGAMGPSSGLPAGVQDEKSEFSQTDWNARDTTCRNDGRARYFLE